MHHQGASYTAPKRPVTVCATSRSRPGPSAAFWGTARQRERRPRSSKYAPRSIVQKTQIHTRIHLHTRHHRAYIRSTLHQSLPSCFESRSSPTSETTAIPHPPAFSAGRCTLSCKVSAPSSNHDALRHQVRGRPGPRPPRVGAAAALRAAAAAAPVVCRDSPRCCPPAAPGRRNPRARARRG